jgi:nucleotide-binding universal stress UspA family protein
LENILMGSVAQKLIRLSNIPLMVVRDVQHSESKYLGASRVLVPTDFSETSKKALEFGISFANFLKADFHLLHSIDLPAMKEFQNQYAFSQTKIPDGCELNVDPVLNSMIKDKAFVGSPFTATVTGDPVEEILKYAQKERIDYIVMGTHGKKGIERVLLGSVASGVVSKSNVPVITISPLPSVSMMTT